MKIIEARPTYRYELPKCFLKSSCCNDKTYGKINDFEVRSVRFLHFVYLRSFGIAMTKYGPMLWVFFVSTVSARHYEVPSADIIADVLRDRNEPIVVMVNGNNADTPHIPVIKSDYNSGRYQERSDRNERPALRSGRNKYEKNDSNEEDPDKEDKSSYKSVTKQNDYDDNREERNRYDNKEENPDREEKSNKKSKKNKHDKNDKTEEPKVDLKERNYVHYFRSGPEKYQDSSENTNYKKKKSKKNNRYQQREETDKKEEKKDEVIDRVAMHLFRSGWNEYDRYDNRKQNQERNERINYDNNRKRYDRYDNTDRYQDRNERINYESDRNRYDRYSNRKRYQDRNKRNDFRNERNRYNRYDERERNQYINEKTNYQSDRSQDRNERNDYRSERNRYDRYDNRESYQDRDERNVYQSERNRFDRGDRISYEDKIDYTRNRISRDRVKRYSDRNDRGNNIDDEYRDEDDDPTRTGNRDHKMRDRYWRSLKERKPDPKLEKASEQAYLFYNLIQTAESKYNLDADTIAKFEISKSIVRPVLRQRCQQKNQCENQCAKKPEKSCPAKCSKFDEMDACDTIKQEDQCAKKKTPQCGGKRGRTMPPNWLRSLNMKRK